MGRKDVGLLPFIDERIDLGGDEFLQDAAGFVVFIGEEHFSVGLRSAFWYFNLHVMAGLVPAIHVFLRSNNQDMDAPDKPGHDESLTIPSAGSPDPS
jgi:hypothetical protein